MTLEDLGAHSHTDGESVRKGTEASVSLAVQPGSLCCALMNTREQRSQTEAFPLNKEPQGKTVAIYEEKN